MDGVRGGEWLVGAAGFLGISLLADRAWRIRRRYIDGLHCH